MSLMGTPMRSGAWAVRELSAAAAAHQLAKALGSARRDCRRCTRPARNHPALNRRLFTPALRLPRGKYSFAHLDLGERRNEHTKSGLPVYQGSGRKYQARMST